jgi:nucleoside-diphosphate-sugar epimerase
VAGQSAISTGTRVLVTGGTGFIGRRLVAALTARGANVRILTRDATEGGGAGRNRPTAVVADLAQPESLNAVCADADVVFHLAGYAHAEDADSDAAMLHHRQVTVEGTRALLAEAVRAGVRRLVFLSSVKAMGEGGEECLGEDAPAQPTTAYGRAKREAEGLVLDAGAWPGFCRVPDDKPGFADAA